MKKISLIVFALLCFGFTKAHFLPKNFKTLKPKIEIRGINELSDYNVSFKVYSISVKRWVKKNKIELANTVAAGVNRIQIVSSNRIRSIASGRD